MCSGGLTDTDDLERHSVLDTLVKARRPAGRGTFEISAEDTHTIHFMN
jgi:hypothetical protein